MKRVSVVAVLAALLAFVLAPVASAAGSWDTLVSTLKQSPVYIEPGVAGTDENTASELESNLHGGDRIVLVMVKDTNQYGSDSALQLAQKVSEALKNERIVAVSSGTDVAAYSTVMPNAVASDLMHRAQSVSTSNVETLGTFVQNVHQWQSENPQAKASKPEPKKGQGSSSGHLLFEAILFLIVVAIIGVAFYVRSRMTESEPGKVRLKKSPDLIKTHLEKIMDLRQHVNDSDLQDTLLQCVTDVEAYFDRYSQDRVSDARTFAGNLDKVVMVLEKEMSGGKKSIEDFATYVVKCIQRGSDAALSDYTVNTQILQAQVWR